MTNFIATLMPRVPMMAGLMDIITDIQQSLYNFIQDVLWDLLGIDWLLEHSIGDDALGSIKDIFFMGNSTYDIYWSSINTILGIIKPVGYALITTFFIIYIFDIASKDQLTFDGITKLGIQLIVVVAIAGNIAIIINAILSVSDSLLNSISSVSGLGGDGGMMPIVGTASDTVKGVMDEWQKNDVALIALIKALGIYLLHQVAVIGAYFAAFSRALDVGWRISFSPIGVANSFEGGSNSAGVKYLKSLAASILSGVVIYVVIVIGFKLAGGLIAADFGGNIFAAMACQLATAGAAIGVSAKAKDIIS